MTRTIIVNDKEFAALDWVECPIPASGPARPPHARNERLLDQGVDDLRPGEASFLCDQTFVFDTTFALKGDNRKFVVLSSNGPRHVAKPY